MRPHYFPSVPRIFEKIYTTATAAVDKEGGLKKGIFWWAIGVGKKVRELERAGRRAGLPAAEAVRVRRQAGASKIRDLFGGNLSMRDRRGADQPGDPPVLRRRGRAGPRGLRDDRDLDRGDDLDARGLQDRHRRPAVHGCEVKIADDGEVLIKGPNIFQGYYKNEEATRETIVDGWLHTGDIGEIDSDGFLSITGRKKDIIITAGGKNITPANLEAEIKQHPLVSQCVVIGDRRPYLVALVTLDPEEAAMRQGARLPDDPRRSRRTPRCRPRSRPTSTRSTRSSPASSR